MFLTIPRLDDFAATFVHGNKLVGSVRQPNRSGNGKHLKEAVLKKNGSFEGGKCDTCDKIELSWVGWNPSGDRLLILVAREPFEDLKSDDRLDGKIETIKIKINENTCNLTI